jgi:hypothetical protein
LLPSPSFLFSLLRCAVAQQRRQQQ